MEEKIFIILHESNHITIVNSLLYHIKVHKNLYFSLFYKSQGTI